MVPNGTKAWVGLLIGVCVAASAVATAGTVSNAVFRIEATNSQRSGFLEFYANELTYNAGTGTYSWTKGLAEILNADEDPIAVLNSANMTIVADPTPDKPYRINLGFAVGAGASDTHFTIHTALLSYTSIPSSWLQPPNGGGRATASFTLTDQNGNGAIFVGDSGPDNGGYTAKYNGYVPGGTTFASLVNQILAGPGGSGSVGQTYPSGTGYEGIPVSVYNMSAQCSFNLTYGDAVSGTTSYRIMPEPGSALCAGLLVLVASLRRR
jgi:hypothetical protein